MLSRSTISSFHEMSCHFISLSLTEMGGMVRPATTLTAEMTSVLKTFSWDESSGFVDAGATAMGPASNQLFMNFPDCETLYDAEPYLLKVVTAWQHRSSVNGQRKTAIKTDCLQIL